MVKKLSESVEEGVSPLLKGFLISLAEQFTAELSLEGWNETLLNGEVGAKGEQHKISVRAGL